MGDNSEWLWLHDGNSCRLTGIVEIIHDEVGYHKEVVILERIQRLSPLEASHCYNHQTDHVNTDS